MQLTHLVYRKELIITEMGSEFRFLCLGLFPSHILTPVSIKRQSLFSKTVEARHLPQLETEHKKWRAKISDATFFSA